MLTIVISCFIFAVLCPALVHIFRQASGWLFAILPLIFFIYFIGHVGNIAHDQAFFQSYAWLPALHVNLSFYLDGLSNLFALLISGVGIFIVIYTAAYLKGHPQLGRFYAYLFLFMGAMFGTVLSSNLFTLFVFWELTSLASFLLINFAHHSKSARDAAVQSLVVTGIGGLALLAACVLLTEITGTANLHHLLHYTTLIQQNSLYTPIAILILIAAFTKSAQFPVHFWLPNAMEAPAPVSAYLHSATMVQAGVYLVARFTPILSHTHLWFNTLTIVGVLTMIVGAYLAFQTTNIKRILAYTTMMSLGLLMFLLASGQAAMVNAAILFFFAHALYKAGLFLVVGNIDHATNMRDITKLQGLKSSQRMSFIAAILCAASMAGIPPLIGFISKEVIYEARLSTTGISLLLIVAVVVMNMVIVALAGTLCFRPFLGKQITKTHPASCSMWLGCLALGALSLLFGLLPYSIDGSLILPAVNDITTFNLTEKLQLWHGATPALGLSLLTISCGILLYFTYPRLSQLLRKINSNYGMEAIYYQLAHHGKRFSIWITHKVQNGKLTDYLAIIFTVTALLIALTFILIPSWPIRHVLPLHAAWYDWLIALIMLISAITIAFVMPYLLTNIVCLGVIGMGSALIFLFYGAPDVALTQVLVDTLTTVILALALYRLPTIPYFAKISKALQIRNLVVAILFGSMITMLLLGATSIPLNETVTRYFNHHAYLFAHGRNIVNVILVDFRALDTFGESMVVALSGLGVACLVAKLSKDKKII